MTYEEFRDLVARTREAQRRYFRDRTGLDECKRLERAVDDELARGRQPSLFGDPPGGAKGGG